MNLHFPAYYHSFRCIAAACPDSCCKEWTVDVDPQSAARYRELSGDLGDRLRSVLKDTEDGTVMEIEQGRCPMWRQDGLCRIQAELGHDALCQTCRDFPRLRHDYGDFVELGLELSCPEAARLILTKDTETLTAEQPGGAEPEYDDEVMALLLESRKAALDFLRSSFSPTPDALAAVLLYAHHIQAQLDGLDCDTVTPADCLGQVSAAEGDMCAVFAFFRKLEILTGEWKSKLEQAPAAIHWSPELRALAVYLIQRYWLQAISDYDLVCRAKLTVVSCLLVGALGGDPVPTAQLFSKEIENDPDNVEAILDAAYSNHAFTDANLLGLLFEYEVSE